MFLLMNNITFHTFFLPSVTEYEIAATTGHAEDAATTENAWIVLEGRKARSKEFVLENKKKKFLRSVFEERLASSVEPPYVAFDNLLSDAGFAFLGAGFIR